MFAKLVEIGADLGAKRLDGVEEVSARDGEHGMSGSPPNPAFTIYQRSMRDVR